MPRMIPTSARFGANSSERGLYSAFESIMDRPDWVILHSIIVRQHLDKLMGEADFIVVVPGKGIVVVEAKAPKSVQYRDGNWTLDGTPHPHRSPLEQVDGAMRSIRSYLLREGALKGDEPFARLLWFTSIGRHHFDGTAPSDLTFFEWELAWADDLHNPAAVIEKVLDEHHAWFGEASRVASQPASVTSARIDSIVGALTRDFDVALDEKDALRESAARESAVLAEQRFALELVESNRAVYFDGPAGTGKSYLIAQAAIDSIKRGERTLLTCWNVIMADRLRAAAKVVHGPLAVGDLGTIMLRAAGLDSHPEDAPDSWYQRDLPRLALAGLAEHPERGGYRAVLVDEFQDIASNSLLIDVLLALAAPDARLVFAGDERQQIMRSTGSRVDPFATAKSSIPELVHARIRRNCRQAPGLVASIEKIVGRPFGFNHHRLPMSTPGSAEHLSVTEGNEPTMLAGVLRLLVAHHGSDGVVVISPWGSRSTAARIVAGEFEDVERTGDLRWLRANLGDARGRIRFGSIAKLKGIEVDAVVITDVGAASRAWAQEHDLDWDDLLYVALSRAKFRAIVLETRPTTIGA